MTVEIFRSENLVIRLVPGGTERCVVTFDSYSDRQTLDRPGFAEAFFQHRDIPAVHVISRGNDWYQYEEMEGALAAVRSAIRAFPVVMTYGSSMGAYAAIRFAGAVGATRVLALSPQYSLDPRRITFEDRWAQDAHRITWRPDIDAAPITSSADIVVAFDPMDRDSHHVALIAAEASIRKIQVRHAGHPVTGFFQDCGQLGELVLLHLDGQLDEREAESTAREARSRSPSYRAALAERQPRHRQRLAVRLLQSATAHDARHAASFAALGRLLSKSGKHDEAIVAHERALALTSRAPAFLHDYCRALFAGGRRAEALDVGREALEAMPTSGLHHHTMAYMLAHDGRLEEALTYSTASVQLEPSSQNYSRSLELLLERIDAAKRTARRTEWLRRMRLTGLAGKLSARLQARSI